MYKKRGRLSQKGRLLNIRITAVPAVAIIVDLRNSRHFEEHVFLGGETALAVVVLFVVIAALSQIIFPSVFQCSFRIESLGHLISAFRHYQVTIRFVSSESSRVIELP